MPLLLDSDRVSTPRHLLDELMKLRGSRAAGDYRNWLNGFVPPWRVVMSPPAWDGT